MHFSATATLLLSTAIAACMAYPLKAVATFTGMNNIFGSVQFIQNAPQDLTYIIANLTGLAEGQHGIHIHQYGDLTNGNASTIDRVIYIKH
jgi:Cu-Zn family superoxide dismutase